MKLAGKKTGNILEDSLPGSLFRIIQAAERTGLD
jgi:hypothetical protein